MTATPVRSTSSQPAPSVIFSSLPTMMISAMPSSTIFAAAIRVLLSLDSGSTIVFLSIFALSLILSIYDISLLLSSAFSAIPISILPYRPSASR